MVKDDKLCCKKCQSTDLVVVPDDDDPLVQHVTCDDCDHEWTLFP